MPRAQKTADIIDGETLRIGKNELTVRLSNVFAPEKGEKGYMDAMVAQMLSAI